jgi:hypothetical protein
MSLKAKSLVPLAFLLAGTSGIQNVQAAGNFSYPTGRACTSSESWTFSDHFQTAYKKEYKDFLGTGKKSLRGFSEAIALRKVAKTPEEKLFSEYWMAHALFDSGEAHVAYQGFIAIASSSPEPETMAIHAAALDCALQIHYLHPSMVVPSASTLSLASYLGADSAPEDMKTYLHDVAWDAETNHVQTLLSDDRVSPGAIKAAISVLTGGGTYETLSQGLWDAKQSDHYKTIEHLNAFVNDPHIPEHLRRFTDTAHILLARAHYSVGEYDIAGDELKKVNKHSNALANSLEELSWAYLLNEKYPEAIGTAMNLEAGGLRHTYEPEAPMVMAMAMNELCQYPESVRAIGIFRKNYEQNYHWLTQWSHDADSSKLYKTSVDFIQRKPTEVPERVASEWIRSPLFISTQEEINLYFDERDAAPKISKAAATEQRWIANDILRKARELKPKLKIAKMKLKPGQSLSSGLRDSLASLKDEVIHWRRMQLAAPVWTVISKRYLATIPTQEGKLIARINGDLKTRNLRMLTQLEEISENIQLIEVEIYNGASEDIIWQNAHPDYKQVAKTFRDEATAPDKVWDWGRSIANSDDNTEIWEDELGSFKANIFDNCSSKDKYLSLHLNRRK